MGGFRDVQSSILCMYSKCGTVVECNDLFCEVEFKDLICWTSMIAVNARIGRVSECLDLFWQMQDDGIYPDEIVLSCVILSFINSNWVDEGKAFHGFIMRRNYVLDHVVLQTLMSMYCRFGMLGTAGRIFDSRLKKDPETCNLMVFECGKGGLWQRCVSLFRDMVCQGVKCDSNSLISAISSCLQLGAIRLGKSIHCYVMKSFSVDNASISNSLIDMYGKSGNLSNAKTIFGSIHRDTVTWNTMISAYTSQEELAQALALFDQMMIEGLSPSSATLVSVLSACSRLALLKKGMQIHNYMKEMEIEFNISLSTALIDMYRKCGELEKARDI